MLSLLASALASTPQPCPCASSGPAHFSAHQVPPYEQRPSVCGLVLQRLGASLAALAV